VRGGNGYIEDWVNPKLVRDAHLGVLWEGTSNINALDVTTRAVAKAGAHRALEAGLEQILGEADGIPGQLRGELASLTARAADLADEVARQGSETLARRASSALYHAASAVLLAAEGARLGARGEDARRLVLAACVVRHRLRPADPLSAADDDPAVAEALLGSDPVDLDTARALAS
jgi:hypothetical protein